MKSQMGKRKMKNRNKQTEKWNAEDDGKQISEVNSMNEENARKREKTDVPVNGMERMQNGDERVQNGGNEAFGLDYAQATLDGGNGKHKIHLLSIIGEVEGHENLSGNTKVTKYDQILPRLAELEDDDSVEGLLVLLNTSGGDVDAGLAIAEMIASLSMPTVSLVQPFHRGTTCSFDRSLFYCPDRDDDGASGAHERNGDRSITDLRVF